MLGAHVQGSILMEQCGECNAKGPLAAYVGKLFPTPDTSAFEAYTRIFSGSVAVGDKVRVLGEAYSPDDEEDSAVAEVTSVCVHMGRYRIPVRSAGAGVGSICCSLKLAFGVSLQLSPMLCSSHL